MVTTQDSMYTWPVNYTMEQKLSGLHWFWKLAEVLAALADFFFLKYRAMEVVAYQI